LKYVQEKFQALDHSKNPGSSNKGKTDSKNEGGNKSNNQGYKTNQSDQNWKRESSTTETSNTCMKKQKLEDRYTKEQLEKLKMMTREEKKKEMCGKCDLYFHKKEVRPMAPLLPIATHMSLKTNCEQLENPSYSVVYLKLHLP